jgi:hypothetical protein
MAFAPLGSKPSQLIRLVPLDGSPFAEQALPHALGIVRRVLKPGEVKDLGDIRSKPPVEVRGK